MADVFISYARSTVDTAQLIAEALRADGYSVWIDADLPVHREFPTVIEENLRAARAVLVLWSKDARASRWVPAEADLAHAAGTLVQFSLDGGAPPFPFNRMQCEKGDGWTGDFNAACWRKIRASIAELVGRQAVVATAPLEAVTAKERRLAVLAFDNLSTDPELTFFSDGVSEEIQQTVAKGSDLKVVARSSSFQFRGADKAVGKVAAALGATHLLDGSVRRSGARVRIVAQLVECASANTLWADQFDGKLDDVFELQERIASAVAQALKVTLDLPAQTRVLDPAMYEMFLRARGILAAGNGMFDQTSSQAAPLLEVVVASAPDYAPAWELLASARAWILHQGRVDYAAARAGVIDAAQTALRLDPKRGHAYVALSLLEPWGAYAVRERLLQQALRVEPNEPGVLTEMSRFCWSVGRFRDALRFAEQACEINPMMPAARLHVAQMRTYIGDYEASIRMHQELHGRWPHNLTILLSLLNFAAGLEHWDAYDDAARSVDLFDNSGLQGVLLRNSQRQAEARRTRDPDLCAAVMQRTLRELEKNGTLPLTQVEAIAELGMAEEAFALAERASYDHMFTPDGLQRDYYPGTILGRWSVLNKTPRFIPLCDRLGLCAYWRQTGAWPDCVDWAPYDFKAEVVRLAAA
ncbi:MAG: TIR domain-containing protein [Caulobacteraceae bacterium]